MEEIIDLLSAYYTTLLEKGYIDQKGQGEWSSFLSTPDWDVPDNVNMDYTGMTHLVEAGYHFWLATTDAIENCWHWVWYKNGQWNDGTNIIPANKMLEIINRSANRLGVEIVINQSSEMSMAARLLDDEMQYEI